MRVFRRPSCAISRVRKYAENILSYDEAQDVRGTSVLRGPKWNGDREREMRSISSLLIARTWR